MFGTPVEGPGSHFASAVYVVPVQPEFPHPSCTIVQPKSDKKVMTPVHQRPPSGPACQFCAWLESLTKKLQQRADTL